MTAVRLSPGSASLMVRLAKGFTLVSSPTFEVVAPEMVGGSLIEVAFTTEEVFVTADDRWPSLTAIVKGVETTAPTLVWLSVGSKVRLRRALVTVAASPVRENELLLPVKPAAVRLVKVPFAELKETLTVR